MKKIILSMTLIAGAAMAFNGSDNFNDNSLSSNWTTNNVGLVEQNQRLEIVRDATGSEQWVNATWNANTGSYVSDWYVTVDVMINSALDHENMTNQWVELELNVRDGARTNELGLAFSVYGEEEDGPGSWEGDRDFYTDIVRNGDYENSTEVLSGTYSGTDATLKIQYTAASETLAAMYDTGGGFITLTNYDVSVWGMADTDVFSLDLNASVADLNLLSGDAAFDNFEAVPEPATGLLLLLAGAGLWAKKRYSRQ